MIGAAPAMVLAMTFEGALHPLIGAMLFAGLFGAAWIVVGYDLRPATDEMTVEPSPISEDEPQAE